MVGGRNHAPAALPAGRDPIPILQEAEWAPGPVWTGAENLGPAGIRSPERPTRSESLYRLSYPGPPTAKDERGTLRCVVLVLRLGRGSSPGVGK